MLLNKTRKTLQRFVLSLGLVALIGTSLAGCQSATSDPTADLIATYNNGTMPGIKQADLDTYVNIIEFYDPSYKDLEKDPSFHENVIKQFVGLDVVYNKVKADAPKDVDQKVSEQLVSMKEYFKSQQDAPADAWEQALKTAKVNETDLVAYLKKTATVAFYMSNQIKDDAVKAAYEEPLKTDKNAYVSVDVRHILVATKSPDGKDMRSDAEALKLAKEVEQKLNDGGDFAKLAKEYSDDPGSKDQGGLYENANPQQYVDAFKKACLELPLNTVSAPIQTEYGYHVMRVEKRKNLTFEDLQDQVRQKLITSKMTEIMTAEIKNSGLLIRNASPSPAK